MKKKKIVFSSSGGVPAMRFLLSVIEHFGNDDVERIAAQLAATCMNSKISISASNDDADILSIYGNTAKSVEVNGSILELNVENISTENNVLIIN